MADKARLTTMDPTRLPAPVTDVVPLAPSRRAAWRRPLLALAALAAVVLVGAALFAGSAVPIAYADDDGERARAALQAGQIKPLQQVLDAVAREWHGQVISVELDHEDGGWVYEVKLLAPHGAVLKLEYDASTIALIKSKGRGLNQARRRP